MKMVFVDIDETLLFTTAKINVVKDGNIVKRLTNQDYNSYELKPGESYDYAEFADSDLLSKTSSPNLPMIDKVKQMYKDGHEVVLLTARGNFDCKETIAKYFNSLGVPVGHYKDSKIHIARTGRDKYQSYGQSHTRKRHVIEKILKQRPDISFIEMYDDHPQNLEEFKMINIPNAAYLVNKENIRIF